MATQIIYLLNTTATSPGWFGRVQDNGSAPAGALSAFGWTVAKVATTTAFWRGRIGATARPTTGAASSYVDSSAGPAAGSGSGSATAGDSFRSDNPLDGTYSAGNWVFTFGMRTGAATNSGRVRFNMWAAANIDGTGSPRKLNSSTLVGTIVTMNSATTTFNSTVTWAAPQVVLNNEYMFLQIEWEVTTAGTSNSCTAQFYQCSFTTPNYVFDIPAVSDSTGPPVFGTPLLTPISPVDAIPDATDFAVAALVFDTPAITSVTSNFTAINFAVAALAIDTETLSQQHALALPGNAVAGVPALAAAAFSQVIPLLANAAQAGVPVLAQPTLGQTYNLIATVAVAGAPMFSAGIITSGLVEFILDAYVIDNGLVALAQADQMLLCSTQPADYVAAQASKLATKALGAGNIFTTLATAADGRKLTSVAIVNGVVNADGNALCWVAVNAANSRLLACGMIDAIAVSTASSWAMDPVTVHMRSVV